MSKITNYFSKTTSARKLQAHNRAFDDLAVADEEQKLRILNNKIFKFLNR
jgi:hypothetical protein